MTGIHVKLTCDRERDDKKSEMAAEDKMSDCCSRALLLLGSSLFTANASFLSFLLEMTELVETIILIIPFQQLLLYTYYGRGYISKQYAKYPSSKQYRFTVCLHYVKICLLLNPFTEMLKCIH